jgi:hypothetical protein
MIEFYVTDNINSLVVDDLIFNLEKLHRYYYRLKPRSSLLLVIQILKSAIYHFEEFNKTMTLYLWILKCLEKMKNMRLGK